MYTAIYTILDCDTDKAHKVASGFCHSVHEVAIEINPLCEVKYVNVHHETEETYKDVTDAIRAGMQVEELEKLLANAQSIESINSISSISNYENELDLESAPRIPDAVYDDLPDTLKLLCELIEHAFQRDVFLIAALPVYASVMTNVEAAHVDGTYTPDIYTMIIANPGTGKGIASKAKKLGDALNDSLGKERIPIPKDSPQNGIPITGINQRKKSLFIPANSSSRAFYDSLQANGECGLIFETEIDTLLNASKQDWGNFSDIIRKAFHHESISINRKNESFSIVCPRLSICITGTFGQFRSMFKSADDGYYSRYAFFTVNAPREWQSHRPTKNSKTLDKSIGKESKRLEKMYRCLQSRGTPLTIDLSDEQFDMIDTIFSSKMHLIDEFNLSEYLQATNKRLAVIAFRLACLFTVLRSYDKDPNNLSTVEELVPSEKDMNAAIALAETFFEHAIRLFQMLPKSSGTNRKGEKFKNFIDALPATFKTSEAIEIGKVFDHPESSVKRWLSNTPELERIEHGTYRKVR